MNERTFLIYASATNAQNIQVQDDVIYIRVEEYRGLAPINTAIDNTRLGEKFVGSVTLEMKP